MPAGVRFKAALDAAGVRSVRFHDLRHTYGTMMASAGVPMRALQDLMGHSNLATTEKYAKWAPRTSVELEYTERAFAAHASTADPLLTASDRP